MAETIKGMHGASEFRTTICHLGLCVVVLVAAGCTNHVATSKAFHAIDIAVEKVDPARLGSVVTDERSGTVQLSSDSPTRIIDVETRTPGSNGATFLDNAINLVRAAGFQQTGAQGWQATFDGEVVVLYVGADATHTESSGGQYAVGFRFESQG